MAVILMISVLLALFLPNAVSSTSKVEFSSRKIAEPLYAMFPSKALSLIEALLKYISISS